MAKKIKTIPLGSQDIVSAWKLLAETYITYTLGESKDVGRSAHFIPGLEKRMTPRKHHKEGAKSWEAKSIAVSFVFAQLDERERTFAASFLEENFNAFPVRQIRFLACVTEDCLVDLGGPEGKFLGTQIVFKHAFLDTSKPSEGFQLVDLKMIADAIDGNIAKLRRPFIKRPGNAFPSLPGPV